MQLNKQQEIEMLEMELKALTQEFDKAMKNDMVLGDVKSLFHDLRILSSKILDLKKQRDTEESIH
jgi:hypothetical protein